jgi:hypothetical protein
VSTSSSVTFRLSDLHSLQEYLAATAVDLPGLRQNVEQSRLAIEPLKAAYELAEEECKPVRDAHNSAMQLKRSEWREADRDALDTYHNYRSWSLGVCLSKAEILAKKG